MLFSIVIPTFRREQELQRCLSKLEPFFASRDDFEVIVSDDSFQEGNPENPTISPAFKRVPGPKRGPAANRNLGASKAKGGWLIFLDDDCIPSSGLLDGYKRTIEANPNCRVVEGRISSDCPQTRMDQTAPLNEKGGYMWSCNFAIRHDLFTELGGFCEDYPYPAMEDVDLRERIIAKGENILFASEAFVAHQWRQHPLTAKYVYSHFYSQQVFFSRHPNLRPTVLQVLVGFLRENYDGIFRAGPRLGFRGFHRWFLLRWMEFPLRFGHVRLLGEDVPQERISMTAAVSQER